MVYAVRLMGAAIYRWESVPWAVLETVLRISNTSNTDTFGRMQ